MPAAVPALAGREQALAWARAERANLIACLDQATGTGQHARIIALTAGLAGLLRHDGPWAEALTRHATALRSAQHLGDRPGQANALSNLGIVRRLTGDYPGAARDLEEALGIFRDLGDRLGQAHALTSLGDVRRMTGDYPGAARAQEEALAHLPRPRRPARPGQRPHQPGERAAGDRGLSGRGPGPGGGAGHLP